MSSPPNTDMSLTDNPYSPPGEDVAEIVRVKVWLASSFVLCVFWGEVLHFTIYIYMQYECMNRNWFAAICNYGIQDGFKTATKSAMEAFTVHHASDCLCVNRKWLSNETRYHGVHRQSRVSRRANSLVEVKLPWNAARHQSLDGRYRIAR